MFLWKYSITIYFILRLYMKIFYINLDRSPARNISSKHQLKIHNVEAERFPAVDGADYCSELGQFIFNKIETKKNYKILRKKLIDTDQLLKTDHPLGIGEIGIIQSLRKLFKLAVTKDLPRILVLEDDFKLCNNFNNKLENVLKDAPQDANILYLGISNLNRRFGSFADIGNKTWQRPLGICSQDYINRTFKSIRGSIFGCYGFIIDKHAMQMYLNFTEIMTLPADVILGHLANKHNRINSYSLIEEDLIKYFRLTTTIHNH